MLGQQENNLTCIDKSFLTMPSNLHIFSHSSYLDFFLGRSFVVLGLKALTCRTKWTLQLGYLNCMELLLM